MNLTNIEWTTFSANPLKYRAPDGQVVWACEKLSAGCQHCYAEHLSTRYGGVRRAGEWNAATMRTLTPFLDEAELRKMRTAKTIGGVPVSGSRCFIGDMTDICGEWVPDGLLNELFSNVLECRTDVTWQILTKRAARMREYLSWRWGGGRIPSRHIHVMVSCENQPTADERIPLLLHTPAAVRGVSLEPLLGPIDLATHLGLAPNHDDLRGLLRWVIVGGESGPGARPMDLAWPRSIVAQCQAAGVACFVKQLGAFPVKEHEVGTAKGGAHRVLRLRDRKGGDMAEWPADLRVRQFPEGR